MIRYILTIIAFLFVLLACEDTNREYEDPDAYVPSPGYVPQQDWDGGRKYDAFIIHAEIDPADRIPKPKVLAEDQPADDLIYVVVTDTTPVDERRDARLPPQPGSSLCDVSYFCPDGTSGNILAGTIYPADGSPEVQLRRADLAPDAECLTPIILPLGDTLSLKMDVGEGGLAGCTVRFEDHRYGHGYADFEFRFCSDPEGIECHPCTGWRSMPLHIQDWFVPDVCYE